MATRGPLPWLALGFSVAAACSSWNPLSAPFGLVVGLASLVLGARALRVAGARRPAAAAIVLSAAAIVASVLVLSLTAGVGRDLAGSEIVPAPARGETSRRLDEGGARTRPARERAKGELDSLGDR